jgi:hypothetical protein
MPAGRQDRYTIGNTRGLHRASSLEDATAEGAGSRPAVMRMVGRQAQALGFRGRSEPRPDRLTDGDLLDYPCDPVRHTVASDQPVAGTLNLPEVGDRRYRSIACEAAGNARASRSRMLLTSISPLASPRTLLSFRGDTTRTPRVQKEAPSNGQSASTNFAVVIAAPLRPSMGSVEQLTRKDPPGPGAA